MSNYSPFHSTNHTDIFSSMMKNYRINRERAKQILNRNSLKKNICKSSSTSMMSNEPSIHDKVQSFFYDRDRMIFRMFGCHKDEIDEVMETGNSTENFIKGKDKMKISKKNCKNKKMKRILSSKELRYIENYITMKIQISSLL